MCLDFHKLDSAKTNSGTLSYWDKHDHVLNNDTEIPMILKYLSIPDIKIGIFCKIEQDNNYCFIIQHIDNKAQYVLCVAEKLETIFFCHISPQFTKLRVSQDVYCVQTMNIECSMTIFGQCVE